MMHDIVRQPPKPRRSPDSSAQTHTGGGRHCGRGQDLDLLERINAAVEHCLHIVHVANLQTLATVSGLKAWRTDDAASWRTDHDQGAGRLERAAEEDLAGALGTLVVGEARVSFSWWGGGFVFGCAALALAGCLPSVFFGRPNWAAAWPRPRGHRFVLFGGAGRCVVIGSIL